MKKTYDDSIILCSNRTDRKIPPHGITATYYDDEKGFTIFELAHTKRDFANRNLTIDQGYFLVTEDGCYKIVVVSYAEKRPKKITCVAVKTSATEIPFYKNINAAKGTYRERKMKPA